MLDDTALPAAINKALAKLLRPLVRLLLRHSFPFSAFEAVAKRVYVDVAMEDFALPGRKPSVSRAAVLTGLTRKEVNVQLEELANQDADLAGAHYNRAARVLSLWVHDADFQDTAGQPRILEVEGPGGFAELVRRSKGDVPWRAVLDELERVGSVRMDQDGGVAIIQRAFVPSASTLTIFGILGTDVGQLIETIAHNMEPGDSVPRFQRKVMHTGIPAAHLAKFRDYSTRKSQALLEDYDVWLSSRDLSGVPEDQWPSHAQVGVGIFYYERVWDAPGDPK